MRVHARVYVTEDHCFCLPAGHPPLGLPPHLSWSSCWVGFLGMSGACSVSAGDVRSLFRLRWLGLCRLRKAHDREHCQLLRGPHKLLIRVHAPAPVFGTHTSGIALCKQQRAASLRCRVATPLRGLSQAWHPVLEPNLEGCFTLVHFSMLMFVLVSEVLGFCQPLIAYWAMVQLIFGSQLCSSSFHGPFAISTKEGSAMSPAGGGSTWTSPDCAADAA